MTDNIKNKVDSIDKSKLNAKTKDIFEQIIKGLRSKDTKISDKSEELLDKLISSAKAKNSDIFVAEKTSKANKEDNNAKVKSRRQDLFDAIQNDPKLSGFNKFQSVIEIDAERVALPKGKRVSKKGWKNQYGKSTGGHTYYETRENRMDRIAPITRSSTPKPWLKYGGEIEEGKYAIVVDDKNGNEKLANTKNSMDEAMAYATLKKNVIGRNGIVKVYNDEKECVYKSFYEDGGYMAEGGGKLEEKVFSIYPHSVGKAKYVIDVYDGNATNKDGSPFIGIRTAQNKVKLNSTISSLKEDGFKEVDNVFNYLKTYEDGGYMDDDEGVDLFEDFENQPEEVSELLSTLEVEDYNYDSLNDLLSEMKKIGYTFEFGLDAEPYDLRKIGQTGKSEYYAEGGELGTINTELINVKNNIMGTTTLEMKIKGMRKPQNFIVYPISAEQANKPIMIQSDTRFGFLDLSTGEGLMSQSHANGAYSYHFQTDKKVNFKLSETDIQRIKSDLSKKAGSKVGNSVIFSDNSGANMMAKGGAIENQYEDRTAEDIWDSWTKEQKMHFLDDHNDEFPNVNRGEKRILSSLNFSEIEDDKIVKSLQMHLKQGQYAEGGKLDESTKMVLSQNKAIAHHTQELKNALKKDPNVEPWVIGKVGRAETDISDVTHYLDGRSEFAEGGQISNNYEEFKGTITNDAVEIILKKDLPNYYYNVTWDYINGLRVIGQRDAIEKAKNHLRRVYGIKVMSIENIDRFGLPFFRVPNQIIDKYRNGGTIGEGRYIIYYEDPTKFSKKRKVASFDSYEKAKEELKKLKYQNEDIDYSIGNKSMFEEKMLSTTFAKGGSLSNTTYISNRNIDDVNIEINKTKKNIKGANIVDGIYVNNKALTKTFDARIIADELANLSYDVWDKLKIESGSEIYASDSLQKKLAKEYEIIEIDSKFKALNKSQRRKVSDILTDENQHSLRNYLALRGYNGETEYNSYKTMYDGAGKNKYSLSPSNINRVVTMAMGGRLGFEGLSDKVAKKYEGMKVPSKYQKEYGKTYSKEEAKEVGNKVAYKVYKKQGVKMAEGGETEWFDYSKAKLQKLPYKLDDYFTKSATTKRISLSRITPIRAREEGVMNANKYMKMSAEGKMAKRKPITVRNSKGMYEVVDGNSTFANAKFSGWKTIYVDVVKNSSKTPKTLVKGQSIFEKAKAIRKEGENWQDALQRAKKM